MEGVVSASSNPQDEAGAAFVTFRVRCESLGHGEDVYLVPLENPSGIRVSLVRWKDVNVNYLGCLGEDVYDSTSHIYFT